MVFLMMIGNVAQDGFGTVELFQEDDAGQLVGQGHVRKTDAGCGAAQYLGIKAPGAAHDEAGATGRVCLAQQVGQSRRGMPLPMFVKHKGDVLWPQGFQKTATFHGVALSRWQGSVTVADFGQFQTAPAGKTLGVMSGGLFPESCFYFANAYAAQGFASHVFLPVACA